LHKGAAFQIKLASNGKAFWLTICHTVPKLDDNGNPDAQRRALTLNALHPGDLRRIAESLNRLADEAERRALGEKQNDQAEDASE
jgi:hypothetical protein